MGTGKAAILLTALSLTAGSSAAAKNGHPEVALIVINENGEDSRVFSITNEKTSETLYILYSGPCESLFFPIKAASPLAKRITEAYCLRVRNEKIPHSERDMLLFAQ